MLCRKNAIFLFIRFYSRGQRRRCGIIMKISYLRWAIEKGQLDSRFASLYGADAVEWQRRRYIRALDRFAINFGDGREDRNVRVYSVSGRSEISGNHTDHNGGCIIGCAIDLDLIAVVSAREDGVIELRSEGFEPDIVRVGDGAAYPRFSSASLISGIAEQIAERGYTVGGFDAYTASGVLRGSGLSSSAAFEMGMASIWNEEYSTGLTPAELAGICQYAENTYFGKPSGLLDQLTSAVGGIIFADFADPRTPKIEKLHADGLLPEGMFLCVTDTRGSHSELTGEFAAIRQEMEQVAACFGKPLLGQVEQTAFWAALPALRSRCGDRAVLRAIHYFEENARTLAQRDALYAKQFPVFAGLVKQSGQASFALCQNVYCTADVRHQGLSVALALSQSILQGSEGAWRMQGGGFAGTIQAYVPRQLLERYHTAIEQVFGQGSCYVLRLREQGAVRVI